MLIECYPVVRQRLCNNVGEGFHRLCKAVCALVGDRLSVDRQTEGKRVKHRDLRGKCLCRCNCDLGSRPDVDGVVGFARYRRADDVYYRIYRHAAALCQTERRKRIGSFARLGDYDDNVALAEYRVGVSEFRRDADIDRNARQLFDRIFSEKPGVHCASAGNDDKPLYPGGVGDLFLQYPLKPAGKMRENSPLQRIGLFVYLLEHEVGIAALFGCLDVPVGGHKRLFRRYVIAAEIKDPDASAGNHCKLLLVDQIVFPCMRKYRGNV